MTKIAWIILIFILVLVGHLVEEINTDFRRKFPLGEMPKPIFIGVNVWLYLFCSVTLILATFESWLAVPLAWIFAVGMLLNGMGHIAIMLVKSAYFPGGVTAFLLVPIAVYLMIALLNIG